MSADLPHRRSQGPADGSISAPVGVVLQHLAGIKRVSPTQWSARCPAHPDRDPSLTVAQGDDGSALVKCQAGCETWAVLAAIDVRIADLFPRQTQEATANAARTRLHR